MRAFLVGAAMATVASFGAMAAEVTLLRPDAYGCKGWHMVNKTIVPETPSYSPKNEIDQGMVTALAKAGECFPLAGSTLQDLRQIRLAANRMAVTLPDGSTQLLWVRWEAIYQSDYVPAFDTIDMSDCENDCRD